MSSLVGPIRIRAPRTAGTAFGRARMALVPVRRTRAPRAPFAVLVFLLLGAGVVGLLMFNTHMQQASFYATSLQNRAVELAAKRQALEMEIAQLRDPQNVALQGRKLGMVVPPNPADLDLGTGRIEGVPLAAGSTDWTRITAPPAALPSVLNPKAIVHRVRLANPPATTATGTATTTGAATTTTTAKTGRPAKNSGHSKTHHGPASP